MNNEIDPFMILLNCAGILSCIAYGLDTTVPLNLYIGIVLFVVTFLSCLFTFIQEGKSDSVMASFDKLLKAPKTSVRRGNREMQVDAIHVVPGDIVLLRSGFKVPADCRIVYCNGLKVEQSSLTGEPEPIPCTDEYNPKFENPIEVCYSHLFLLSPIILAHASHDITYVE
jgi:magnesium-transporting ATPase (P-type)